MKYLFSFVFLAGFFIQGISQDSLTTISIPESFSRKDHSIAYYDSVRHQFHIIFQDGQKIERLVYDTSFNVATKNSYKSSRLSFKKERNNLHSFLFPLISKTGLYEVFAGNKNIVITQPVYNGKRDSILSSFLIGEAAKDERLLSVFPGNKEVRVLTASVKKKSLFLYSVQPGGDPVIAEIPFPNSLLSEQEKKTFVSDIPKAIDRKLKSIAGNFYPHSTREDFFILPETYTRLFYSDTCLYIPLQLGYGVGISLLKIGFQQPTITVQNFFMNDFFFNRDASGGSTRRSPLAIVYDSILLVSNKSGKYFSYHFYDVRTNQLLKKYESEKTDSLENLFHSPVTQQGTWLSQGQTKTIDNNNSILRKMQGSNIFVSQVTADSLVISSIVYTETMGIEGTLLAAATSIASFGASLHMGNYQVVGYLYTQRNKISFAHSKFSNHSLLPSQSGNTSTFLDRLFDDFSRRDFAANSTFLVKKGNKYFLGVLNPGKSKYTIYSYNQ